jgi:GntR family transcriptional regulator / MocR family aminotransferase
MAARATFPFDVIVVDRTLSIPIHRQVYEALRTHIIRGHITAGSRLPATRLLAEALDVGRNTVIAAYQQLLTDGYLEARSGSGTWVTETMQHAASSGLRGSAAGTPRLSRRSTAILGQPRYERLTGKINFQPGSPETDTFPFSTWARLLAKNARRRTDDLLSYSHYAGHPALREAVAEYVGVARGVNCSTEQVIIVTGAQAALDLLARTLIDDGEVAWMEEPGYVGARTALLVAGARLMPLRVGEKGWQIADPTLPAPRLIYVTPSCQWPSGAIMRLEDRLQLLGVAARHGAWIVEDDYDGEYRFRGKPVSALQGLDRSGCVIYIGTFGKTLFQSLRLGFMIVPVALTAAFERIVGVTGHFAPLILQATLADFIRQGHFATHLKRMRALYALRQQEFIALCHKHLGQWMTVLESDSGIQLLGRFKQPFDDREVVRTALSRGVNFQPASESYFFDPPQHGLLLGYAGLSDSQRGAAISALRRTFEILDANRHRYIVQRPRQ